MNDLLTYIAVVGTIETVILIVGLIYAFILWVRGVFPALLRLGNGLAKRQIAIFAKGDNVSSIKNLLLDSDIFRAKNIFEITKKEDINKAEKATLYLVVWEDWADCINDILAMKPDKCALIVYAPYNKGRIPDDQMVKLDGKRHTSVTNFRGRLLNDVLSTMITTNYKK